MVESILQGVDSIISKFVPDQTKQEEFRTELRKLEIADRASARSTHHKRLESKDAFIRRFVPVFAICLVSFYVVALLGLFL